jgi:ferredoxin
MAEEARYRERRIAGLTVRIDRHTCIASENCIELAPDVFGMGEDNIVEFRDASSGIERDRLIEACAICPVDALSVLDEDGERLVP